jgi:hypothetical protein
MDDRRITATDCLEWQRQPGETIDDVARRVYRRNKQVMRNNAWQSLKRHLRGIFGESYNWCRGWFRAGGGWREW